MIRLTFWAVIGLFAFAAAEMREIPKLEKRLDVLTNTFDPIQLTNSFWFDTEMEIKQRHISNYTTVEWVGKIVTADTSDPRKNPFSYLRDCELGLRSDGIVVWREAKK